MASLTRCLGLCIVSSPLETEKLEQVEAGSVMLAAAAALQECKGLKIIFKTVLETVKYYILKKTKEPTVDNGSLLWERLI